MNFDQPYLLLGLLAVPILLAAYLWQTRRRKPAAVRYSNVALVRTAVGPSRRWRRHLPVALVIASLGLLAVAAARPQVKADVPISSSTVILALDVSGSMCATDVEPNRLSAAQAAVRKFVETQGDDTKIGLVLFSGFAQLAVAPTTNKTDLLNTLDAVTTGRGTTIGAAILKSIDAISEINPSVAPADTGDGTGEGPDSQSPTPGTPTPAPERATTVPEIVVLLTDGANTRGVTPEEAAVQAAARGVRVFPIGFGTTEPTQMVCTSDQLGGGLFDGPPGGFGGGLGPGGRNFLVVDEEALQTVARTTGGEYFKASDADQLQGVLNDLPKHVDLQERDVEISVGFAGVAALMLLLGLWLAGRWSAHPQ